MKRFIYALIILQVFIFIFSCSAPEPSRINDDTADTNIITVDRTTDLLTETPSNTDSKEDPENQTGAADDTTVFEESSVIPPDDTTSAEGSSVTPPEITTEESITLPDYGDREYCIDSLIITIIKDYSEQTCTVSDFPEIELSAVETNWDMGSSCILTLTLKEPGKNNVLRAIALLLRREDITSAEPNFLSTPAN